MSFRRTHVGNFCVVLDLHSERCVRCRCYCYSQYQQFTPHIARLQVWFRTDINKYQKFRSGWNTNTNWPQEMEFITSNKGGVKLCYKGHMYTRKKISVTRIRWVYSRKIALKCSGAVTTSLTVSLIFLMIIIFIISLFITWNDTLNPYLCYYCDVSITTFH